MATWRTSGRSNGTSCVEVALGSSSVVLVRDSKDRDGAVLTFTLAEWEAFIGGVRDGEFDLASLHAEASTLV
jgi:hypothetical protein